MSNSIGRIAEALERITHGVNHWEDLTDEEAEKVIQVAKLGRSHALKQLDLFHELLTLGELRFAMALDRPAPRLPEKCPNCGKHDYDQRLVRLRDGLIVHPYICWER